MRHLAEEHSVFLVDIIDDAVDSVDICINLFSDFSDFYDFDLGSFDHTCDDSDESTTVCSIYAEISFVIHSDCDAGAGSDSPISLPPNINLPFPSTIQPPFLELKPLPEHLKYAYLDDAQKLQVIKSSSLSLEHEDKLLHVLRGHKKDIRWTLVDLHRINPSICMHRIHLEDDSRPVRQPQRRLNPTILDVVKKEVMKLLAVGIIYPIFYNTWVSPVQVVTKKSGITIVKNQDNELNPTRVANSWRVCIDYRKLNQETHKDHFPLPLIDQVLERLVGKSHYCFLDGFLGYMQIHITLEDQHKSPVHLAHLPTPGCLLAYAKLLALVRDRGAR